jgi:hypothetical protein
MIGFLFSLTTNVLVASTSNDMVNERFTAQRQFYEEQWDIRCPNRSMSDSLSLQTFQTLQLCRVLDERFEEDQLCEWWHSIDRNDITFINSPELSEYLTSACTSQD